MSLVRHLLMTEEYHFKSERSCLCLKWQVKLVNFFLILFAVSSCEVVAFGLCHSAADLAALRTCGPFDS